MLQGERKKLRKAREHPLTARSFSPIDIVSRKFGCEQESDRTRAGVEVVKARSSVDWRVATR